MEKTLCRVTESMREPLNEILKLKKEEEACESKRSTASKRRREVCVVSKGGSHIRSIIAWCVSMMSIFEANCATAVIDSTVFAWRS